VGVLKTLTMEEHLARWYPALLHLHRTLVGLSVLFFAARATGVAARHIWPLQPAARWGSVLIDTVLMATGIALWVLMQHHPLREPWLGLKLVLLLVYIVLGSYGLKRGATRIARMGFSVLALLVAAHMIGVARTRSPLGWLAPWLGA
jgi:uncharacterized membrane protein SirB2